MKHKRIIAEVFLESQIGTDTEEVLFTGPLGQAYWFWMKYNHDHPFDPEAVIRFERPDGSMYISTMFGRR